MKKDVLKTYGQILMASSILLLLAPMLQAQDLSKLSKQSQSSLSGSVRAGSFFNHSFNHNQAIYAPFGYNISGGLTGSWKGINIPVSFSFNHQNGQISNPFNLYGASPYYKWIKLHVGFRSMNYGPYVFSGKAFRGLGVELSPGKFRFSAFSGTIRNILAIEDPNTVGIITLPSYRRKVYGAQVGVAGKVAGFELSGIQVRDEVSSIVNSPLSPLENVVIGSKLYFKFFKIIKLEANIAGSVTTQDQNAAAFENLPASIKAFDFLVNPNTTTRFSFAGDASLMYQLRGVQAGVQYRRIEPFYRSLGINFIQSDIENYTLLLGFPALKRKLRFNGTAGVQRDNLLGYKAFTSFRRIGSANVNYAFNRRFSLMLRFANYQIENQSGFIQVNDTLKFVTVTRNFNISTRVVLIENAQSSTSLTLNGFRNEVVTETGRVDLNRKFNGTGLNGKLLYDHKELALGVGPVVNYNIFDYSDRTQTRLGTGVNLTKSWFQHMFHTSLVMLYNFDKINQVSNGNFLNFSIQAQAKLKKGHTLQFSLFYMDNSVITGLPFRETRGQLAYVYSFQQHFKKEEK